MPDLNKIDSVLSKQFTLLSKEIKSMSFVDGPTFKLSEITDETSFPELDFPGIYLFEIKTDNTNVSFNSWVKNLKAEWESKKYLKKHTPKFADKRVKMHSDLNDWMPIYIGKSEHVGDRIHQHLFKKLTQSTSALKLMERENLKKYTFRVSTIEINVKNYPEIVTRVEQELRNKFNPVIGKQ